MNNTKKNLLSSALLLVHLNAAQAIIFGDEERMSEAKSHQPQGTYSILISSSEQPQNKKMGTATLFKTPDGAYYGLSNAHALAHLPNEFIGLQTGREKLKNNISMIHLITNCTPHSLYNPFKSWDEQSKYDAGIFSLTKKGLEGLNFFEGEIYNKDLIPETVYPITLNSFGPIFDSNLTSYQASGDCYHQTPLEIIYSEKGFFYRNVKSRHFYVSFSLGKNGGIKWFCDLLPEKGDVGSVNGDSGGLALTSSGEAIALQRGRSWSEFYKKNKELAPFVRSIRSDTKDSIYQASINPQEALNSLLTQIHHDVANEQYTKHLETENGVTLYRFTLQEKYPDLVGTDYFTPLSLFKDNINQFIENYKKDTQPFLKKSELYKDLRKTLRPLKEKELNRTLQELYRMEEEILKRYTNIVEMENTIEILKEEEPQNLTFTETDLEKISILKKELNTLQGVQGELRNLTDLKMAYDNIRQKNLDVLDWFYKNKNKLKEENPILTEEDQAFLKRVNG